MIKNAIFGLLVLFAISCNNNDTNDDAITKQANGNVWLSGGLAYCAEQIHLTNGDTLIVSMAEIIAFKSGDKVTLKYKEMGVNEFCSPSIDCEIIEIKKVN
jgi:hypothetical protein